LSKLPKLVIAKIENQKLDGFLNFGNYPILTITNFEKNGSDRRSRPA